MRCVLYAHDMEPITVFNLTEASYRFLRKNRMAHLPIPSQKVKMVMPGDPIVMEKIDVRVVAEIVFVRGVERMILVTPDEECALLLKCAFLPGQVSGVQEHEKSAFSRGVLYALSRLGEI